MDDAPGWRREMVRNTSYEEERVNVSGDSN